jgi:hypothetical protein
MPAALATAATTLDDPRLLRPAVRDSATFVPWLLTSGGPDNGRLPLPTDRTQIAYGVDSRVQSLLATADATGRPSFRRLAAVMAAWFFGANPAGVPAYDPATGRTVDGIAPDGTVNRNAGAESTIHGLLTMLALDASPSVAASAQRATAVHARVGAEVVEAEGATLAGAAGVVTPASSWTGEAAWSGSYVAMGDDGRARLGVPAAAQPRLVLPVVDLQPDSSAVTSWRAEGRRLGRVRSGAVGAQGASPAPGALLPVTLPRWLPASADALHVRARAAGSDEARIDAVMLEPRVSSYVLTGGGSGTAVLRSAARVPVRATVSVPGAGRATVEIYNAAGRLAARSYADDTAVVARVLPGGFTVVRR